MPFHLDKFYGGLGNQLFSIVTVYSLAKKYKTTFSINEKDVISTGFVNNYVYFNVFDCLIQSQVYSMQTDSLPLLYIKVEQFKDYEFDKEMVQNHKIVLQGLSMKYSLFGDYIKDVSTLFLNKKNTPLIQSIKTNNFCYYQIDSNGYNINKITNLCIALRTFSSQNTSQWATSFDYYDKAITYLSSKIEFCNIHFYTDQEGSSKKFLDLISQNFGERCISISESFGKKEDQSDIEHFFQMMENDHFILCNSTYHYWSALLSDSSKEKIVTYPKECEWFSCILSPEWIPL